MVSAPPDALLAHLSATMKLRWDQPPAPVASALAALDAQAWVPTHHHLDFLRLERDKPDAHTRAARYLDALALARSLAMTPDRPLDWSMMCQVQALVLGRDAVGFRQGDAFAKGGQRRYGWYPELEGMFKRKIAADVQAPLHPIIQAARLYLDVIFFHPFEDGNARAARLWFDHLCWRGRITAPAWVELARQEKRPGDIADYWRFVKLSAMLSAAVSRSAVGAARGAHT